MISRNSRLVAIFFIATCFFSLSHAADILSKQFIIETSPLRIEKGGVQNKSICFADCSSCQAKTGDCEKCFNPWYELRDGKCALAFPEYKLQSTEEEQRFQNFIASSEWSNNGRPVTSKICTPSTTLFSKNITIIGPFDTNTNITYQRTLSQHNYWGMKFLLILSNWTSPSTSLRIKVTNEAGNLIEDRVLSLASEQIASAYNEDVCSKAAVDKRVSVSLEVRQEQSSELILQFIGNMDRGASWGLSSFVLITGKCNQNCALCDKYTPRADGCLMCNNFLANNDTSGQKCSTCLDGFSPVPAQNKCQKCPIQFKSCKTSPPVCLYQNITNSSQQCSFTDTVFFDKKQLVEQTFFGSLFTIQNKGAVVTRCGAYSIVGPANFGDVIARTFVQLPPHIQFSINFNIFIFQQKEAIQRYTIVIFLNGQPLQISPSEQTINITGTSSECDLWPNSRSYEAMKTFETQTFTSHNKLENVVVGISLGTSTNDPQTRWGVRDVRLVFKRCDENCEICTESGCQRCKGFFQLNRMQCSDCLVGTGLNMTAKTCQPCPSNCVQCSMADKTFVCSQCLSGFYLYRFQGITSCERNPTYGTPVPERVAYNGNCSVTIPGQVNRTLNFTVYQNNVKMPHKVGISVRKNIQFYLMKIDDWEGDYLDIYANDLLIQRLQFGAAGTNYCGDAQQGDQISLQQFDIEDDNSTVLLEFEAVHKTAGKQRKFAISNLAISPAGCINCQNYDFLYRVKYNYDERLFAEMAFNLVYPNTNPAEFKNIFKLKAGDRYLDYEISQNDSIRYWLKSERIDKGEILQKNLTVQCLYPQRVTAQIPSGPNATNNLENSYQFFDRRVLQSQGYQTTKTIDNGQATVFVDRYSPLRGRQQSVLGLQTFFSVLTRMVIYLGFASFFVGCQTPCTHVMHNFQKLWVHIYVAALALSPILKTALWGFRESQDQNIAVNPDVWQSPLPYLYYDAPAQYQHYYQDITFFRHIYNVGVAFAILTLVFVIFHCLFKNIKKDSEHIFFRHFRIVFARRPMFFFNSLIFYQYFTVCLACCLQFLDLKTRTNEPTFASINAAACIIAFIFATLYPTILHIYIQRKRGNVLELMQTIMGNNRNKQFANHQRDLQLLEEHHVKFTNNYSEIFYRFTPELIFNENLAEAEMITEKHIFYNLFRYGDLWWHAIVVILLHYSPFAQAFLLILTNGFHLAINAFTHLNTNKFFRILKSLELLFFIVLEIMIIVMLSLLKTLRFQSYETIGIVAIIFVFFILATTFARFFYSVYKLWKDYHREDQRMVIRRDKGFKLGWLYNQAEE